MYEHATLQEAYTGSLIAGKGKLLNNIKQIMTPLTRFPYEDWVRVRFGAGTPWRRCWCVITPPDAKMAAKQKKEERRDMKKSAYQGMTKQPGIKGEIRFYDTKKVKKMKPVAIVNDAFSAFAIYPHSKPLIDQSSLIKLEGTITINSHPPAISEGFVFVMPEVHAAVSGFEVMLRWLFPAFDTYGLYGRPNALVADIRDTRSLMFAMPQEQHYGYLEILDIVGLMSAEGSGHWKEYEWRAKLKELTARRISALSSSGPGYRAATRAKRNSMPSRPGVMFDTTGPADRFGVLDKRSLPISHHQNNSSPALKRSASPPKLSPFPPRGRARSGSAPPTHVKADIVRGAGVFELQDRQIPILGGPPANEEQKESETRSSSEEDRPSDAWDPDLQQVDQLQPPEPVALPPPMAHAPTDKPLRPPQLHPELRRTKSRMSSETLAQLAGASHTVIAPAALASEEITHAPQQETLADPARLRSVRNSNENLRRGVMNSGFDRGESDYSTNQAARSHLPVPSMGKRLPAIMGSPAVGYDATEYFADRTNVPALHPLPAVPEPAQLASTPDPVSSQPPASLRPGRQGPRNRYGGPADEITQLPAQAPALFPTSRSQSPVKRKIISPYVTNSASTSKEASPTRDPLKIPSPQKLGRKPIVGAQNPEQR